MTRIFVVDLDRAYYNMYLMVKIELIEHIDHSLRYPNNIRAFCRVYYLLEEDPEHFEGFHRDINFNQKHKKTQRHKIKLYF